jgi:hypothetical protein
VALGICSSLVAVPRSKGGVLALRDVSKDRCSSRLIGGKHFDLKGEVLALPTARKGRIER